MARDSFSKVGCVFNLIVFAYIAFILFQAVPVLYNKVELETEMERVARSYHTYRNNTNKMKEIISRKAYDLEIPVSKKDVKVFRRGKTIVVSTSFDKEFNLLVTKKKWKFEIETDAPIIDF